MYRGCLLKWGRGRLVRCKGLCILGVSKKTLWVSEKELKTLLAVVQNVEDLLVGAKVYGRGA